MPAVTAFGALEPHASVHVAPEAQVMEQVELHVMLQLELAAQLMLPLSPTVTLQLAFAAHSTLHDLPHVPLQLEESAHLIEQLSAVSQPPKLHDVPAGQLQLVPVQVAGGAVLVPELLHAHRTDARTMKAMRMSRQ